MQIIADSSALIALATCESLDILQKLYDIKVPPAVYEEVVKPDKPLSAILRKFLDNCVVEVDLSRLVISAGGLGQGEIEAMALYKQISADSLLIDDRRARAIAEHNNIQCIGVLGILLIAKHKGMIKQISPFIEKLRTSSIYYGEALLRRALQLANED